MLRGWRKPLRKGEIKKRYKVLVKDDDEDYRISHDEEEVEEGEEEEFNEQEESKEA